MRLKAKAGSVFHPMKEVTIADGPATEPMTGKKDNMTFDASATVFATPLKLQRMSTKFVRPAANGLLAASTALMVSSWTSNALAQQAEVEAGRGVLWQGSLLVQQHGKVCQNEPTTPYRLPVWAVQERGQWWIWGGMAPMRVQLEGVTRSQGQALGAASLTSWIDTSALGQVVLKMGSQRVEATWREIDDAGSCTFTQAQLELQPHTASPSEAQGLHMHQRTLQRSLELGHALEQVSIPRLNGVRPSRSAQRALLQELHALSQSALAPSVLNDMNLALTWLKAGSRASSLKEHQLAAELQQASLMIYLPRANQGAGALQAAALALGELARTQQRAGDRAQARQTLEQAFALLREHGGTQSAAASSLHNQSGAYWLREQRPDWALNSFTEAIRADEARRAPVVEQVASLMNSAVAFEDIGQPEAARSIYERCRALLSQSGALSTDQENLSGWVEDRLRALVESGQAELSNQRRI